MTTVTKKARQVRCISCKRWAASARYSQHPHGSNVYSWIRGGTIHAKCLEIEWDKATRERDARRRTWHTLDAS